jgi:hypothetical protein
MALQYAGGIAHPDRQRGRIVDADVPVTTLQRFEIAVAVAEQRLDRAGPGLLLTTAVEDGDMVPAIQCVAHLVRADETRAAQDQQAHRLQGPHVCKGRQGQGRGCKGGELDEVPAAGVHGAHPLPMVMGPPSDIERNVHGAPFSG